LCLPTRPCCPLRPATAAAGLHVPMLLTPPGGLTPPSSNGLPPPPSGLKSSKFRCSPPRVSGKMEPPQSLLSIPPLLEPTHALNRWQFGCTVSSASMALEAGVIAH
jgi:hypothetical protein